MPFTSRTKMLLLMLLLLAAGGVLFTLQRPGRAEAHPLGNFTINRYSRIELAASGVHVRYVIDMAEIPTYQEHDAIDVDGNGEIDPAEQTAYMQQKAEALRTGLDLEINRSKVALHTASNALSFLPGQGGLDTQRMVIDYTAALPDGWQTSAQRVAYHDTNYEERIGWREIIVRPLDGVRLANSDVPQTDVSNELLSYPKNSISNPLNVTSASFEFTSAALGSTDTGSAPAPVSSTAAQSRATRGNPDSTLARYAGLIAKDRLSAGVIILALLAAIGFGALHALSPGHGKTIVGAYLVGSRGTWRHALLLSLTVTVTHTSSVYALGFVTLYLSAFIVPEKLYPWLSIGSGGLVLAMGFALLVSRLRASHLLGEAWASVSRSVGWIAPPQLAFEQAGAHDTHDGPHGDDAFVDHSHLRDSQGETAHEHRHGLGRAHSHTPIDASESPLTWRGLIGLGVFGGLLPCPSAIVVMLSAIALHRVAFGLLLIVAFSSGLAIVLTSIGLLLVYAGSLSRRLPFALKLGSRLGNGGAVSFAVRAFPAGSAAAVVIAGLVLTAHGLAQQGFL